jgi:large subunit ribosomal protein L6
MSRIGRKPVEVPSGIKTTIAGKAVKVAGPKGELNFVLPAPIDAAFDSGSGMVTVSRKGNDRQARAMHGMVRATIANMVQGVEKGFQKRLLIYGTGYGCNLAGRKLQLNCGFMGRGGKNKFQFELEIPKGVDVDVEVAAARGDSEPAKLVVRGCDKQAVGQFAAELRRIRPPEPYKGKGIRYENEFVRRKVGKALAGAGG